MGESDSARENEAVRDLKGMVLGKLEGFKEKEEEGIWWGLRRKRRVEEEEKLERG